MRAWRFDMVRARGLRRMKNAKLWLVRLKNRRRRRRWENGVVDWKPRMGKLCFWSELDHGVTGGMNALVFAGGTQIEVDAIAAFVANFSESDLGVAAIANDRFDDGCRRWRRCRGWLGAAERRLVRGLG